MMTGLFPGFLITIVQIGVSTEDCVGCACCRFGYCDPNEICIFGCVNGFHGDTCIEECLENCKSCTNGSECTECKPGYYSNICAESCGKGCVNKTCSRTTGECPCKSTNFIGEKCNICAEDKYGDECNKKCPSNCGSCLSDTECLYCKYDTYYGSHCQHECSTGCLDGRCYKENGYCIGGCNSGYTGYKCDTCSPGIYGTFCQINCTESCSPFVRCTETLKTVQGHSTSTLIGSILGAFIAGCLTVGAAAFAAFNVWKRRLKNKQTDEHEYEKPSGPGDVRSNDNMHESYTPATYEDLRSRDDRLYSQLAMSQQISSPISADYVNHSL